MNLKSIELVGFKSFADRTFVQLHGGITGIVGPNGCGKSNIVDALRWSLGEMSPRSLRSKQMLDVIFSGSTTRAALNMSEVTLTFDNTHHLLPIDFTEVQVTRKLFRSGESEYFLNKTQCRLKDIKDLFMDTGMSEGYSILAQGEVDFVISSKPEERRVLFEEAAGISKYKARREETLRKLEKVELDLSRLNDVLSLVNEQMRQLENAAKKAKAYKDVRQELRSMEIADALDKLQTLRGNLQGAQTQNEQIQNQSRQITVDLDQAEAQWTQNRLSLDACEKQLFTLNSSLFELDKNIAIADQTLRLAAERETESAQREVKARGQISQMQAEQSQITRKLEENQQELQNARGQEGALKESYDKEKQLWQSLSKTRQEQENSKNQKFVQLQQVTSQANQLKSEQSKFSSLNFNREIEIASLKKDQEKAILSQSVLEQELQNLKTAAQEFVKSAAELSQTLPALKADQQKDQERSSALSAQVQELKNARLQRQTQLQTVEQFLASNPYRKGTEAVLNQGFAGLKNVVGLLLKYPQELSGQVSAVLGRKLDYLVFDQTAQAEAALEWLRQNNLGRATCIVLEKLPSVNVTESALPQDALNVFDQIKCDPDLEKLKQYLIAGCYAHQDKIYFREIIDGGSQVVKAAASSGAVDIETNPFLVRENLQKEIGQIESDLVLKEQENQKILEQLQQLRLQIQTQNDAFAKLQLQSSHYKDLVSKKEQELQNCQKEIATLNARWQKDEQDRLSFTQSISNAQQKLESVLAAQVALEQEREEMQKQIEQQRAQEYEAGLRLKECELRLENFRGGLKRLEQAQQEWQTRLQNLQQRQQDLNQEIESAQAQIIANQNLQQEETIKIQNFHQQKSETSNQSQVVLKEKTVFEEKNKTLDAALQQLRQNQKESSEQLHQAQMQLRGMENESKNITTRLQENYNLTIEQAAQEASAKAADPDALQRLRKRVENMGNSINLEAPEQYQALQERFQFLNTQVQDLQTAKEDLKKAIQQINASTREQFKETFIKVRENFIQIFGILFSSGGGVADLIFTDENNVLETGIDIVAQPPGKKPQNIALLSGGEKTLTAIALLFAFFMVKPSPFCVMDEVDAPLDPANVGRYLKLLKDFSNKTQFIVVTHNPKTMEMADVLYGVTMEESGVSRLLSAKLKKENAQETIELSKR